MKLMADNQQVLDGGFFHKNIHLTSPRGFPGVHPPKFPAGSSHDFSPARELARAVLNAGIPFSALPRAWSRRHSGVSVKNCCHAPERHPAPFWANYQETAKSHWWRRGPAGKGSLHPNFFVPLNRFSIGFPPLTCWEVTPHIGPCNLDSGGMGFVEKFCHDSLFPGSTG